MTLFHPVGHFLVLLYSNFSSILVDTLGFLRAIILIYSPLLELVYKALIQGFERAALICILNSDLLVSSDIKSESRRVRNQSSFYTILGLNYLKVFCPLPQSYCIMGKYLLILLIEALAFCSKG